MEGSYVTRPQRVMRGEEERKKERERKQNLPFPITLRPMLFPGGQLPLTGKGASEGAGLQRCVHLLQEAHRELQEAS